MTHRRALQKTSVLAGALLLVLTAAVATPPANASAAPASPDKKEKQIGRLLYGKVLDQQDNPVVGAIVYLTNTRTHAVKTYIVSDDGTYRFPGLTNVDYEVYAQINDHKSDTKSVSQFDDRTQVYIDLRLNTK
jgi:Carboxypeptidase regulatory-like domain